MKPTSQNDYLLKDYSNNIKITSRAVFTENGLEADFAMNIIMIMVSIAPAAAAVTTIMTTTQMRFSLPGVWKLQRSLIRNPLRLL